MNESVIGREEELKQLQKCLESQEAQLVIVYGRRRVGKTFLINHFFNGRFDFKLTGDFKGKKKRSASQFLHRIKASVKINRN